ncbi:Ig-like domain-containing protein [[Brevibacterium] frigoritolerans]|nr:Ig-like domain-containing protein [Peribacillus frigoritolerans]
MTKGIGKLTAFIVLFLMTSLNFAYETEAASPIKVYVDGSVMTFTKAPYQSSNKQTYVEFDTVYKKMGYKINTRKNTISYSKKGYSNKMDIGKTYVYVNGKKKTIGAPIQKVGKKVYVPVTAIPVTSDKTVRWSKNKTAIFIEGKNPKINVTGNITSLTLEKGARKNIDVSSTKTILKDEDVVWKTSNSKVAVVDSKGNITAVSKGTASITITIPNSTSSYKMTVTVTPKKVKSISLPKTVQMLKGSKKTLKYTVSPADAEEYQIIWTSSNSGVVEVSSKGEIKAVKTGKATVKAALKGSSSIIATTSVTVQPKEIEEIKLPTDLKIEEGQKQKLKYTTAPVDAEEYKVRWSSSRSDIVDVKQDGEIVALKPGLASITVRVEDSHQIYAVMDVLVTEKILSLEDVKGTDGPTLQKYFSQHYKELQTPLGDWKPEFSVQKYEDEMTISIGYGRQSPFLLKYDDPTLEEFEYGRILTAQEKMETKQLLRAFMQKIASDVFYAFPDDYVKARFYTSGYKYPHIKEGFWYTSFLTWDNGVNRGDQLKWDPKGDDYNFVLDQPITELFVTNPNDGKLYGSKGDIPTTIYMKKGEKIKLQLSVTPAQDISQYTFKELGFRTSSMYKKTELDENGYIEAKQIGRDFISIYFDEVNSLFMTIQVVE